MATHIYSYWSCLPHDLLELLISKLRYESDLVRFKGVCKSWQSVDVAPDFVTPLFISLVYGDRTRGGSEFLEMWDEKIVRKVNLLQFLEKYAFRNFTQGWLVCQPHIPKFGPVGQFRNNILLVNYPFSSSGSHIRLPPVHRMFVSKVVASSDPLNPNCMFLMASTRPGLSFCRAGDEEWRSWDEYPIDFPDIIFHNNYFYALDITGKTYVLMEGIKGIELMLMVDAPPIVSNQGLLKRYLVQSSENLLQVVMNVEGPHHYREILKLNFDTRKWDAISSMGDNKSLLWSRRGGCYLVSTKCFPKLRSNCIIYFFRFLWSFDLKTGKCEKIMEDQSLGGFYWYDCFIPYSN